MEALAIMRRAADSLSTSSIFQARFRTDNQLAELLYEAGELAEARSVLDRAADLERIADPYQVVTRRELRAAIEAADGDADAADGLLRSTKGLPRLWIPEVRCRLIETHASVALDRGSWRPAARLLGAADGERAMLRTPRPAYEVKRYERARTVLERELGAERLAEAMAEGAEQGIGILGMRLR